MRRPWILSGLMLVFLGATWLLQGAEVLDGGFFSDRTMSLVFGAMVVLIGLASMSWAYLRLR